MNIRGLHPFTLVDFPGRIACIIFVGECNFRCPYCHNPCLVFDPESQPRVPEEKFFEFLEKRKGKLEGVVISGGEPILQKDLLPFIKKVKKMGYLVKLDTNGSMPERVFAIHNEAGLDAMGVDYKAPVEKYVEISRNNMDELGNKVLSVIKFALDNNIQIDVRTTVHRALLSIDDLRQMRSELNAIGLETWTLQQFNPVETIDENLPELPTFTDHELVRIAEKLGNDTRVRGLKSMVIKS
ncbi:MAG: anaerobic ribonucleoside-triphosphate reductase activating protein [Lentisphaerae bacterium]|nr:anaerobic ribonucleoside-triphosphate reductase activating protein [Lentisphaerota bacterium]MCP4103042.1 anaerobic ribonucleoside-triphosphate reductase activating protein [Lentisphaerota bacterium]